MPIIAVNILDGPNIQDDDQYRGVLEFIFDTGLKIKQNVRAIGLSGWDALPVKESAELEIKISANDAEQASNTDNDITAVNNASIKQVAIAYLRKAYSTGNPYLAYKKFNKFNDYRMTQGWSINQVVSGLSEVGLTQTEWDLMYARYAYLSNTQIITDMQNYQAILSGDVWGDKFR